MAVMKSATKDLHVLSLAGHNARCSTRCWQEQRPLTACTNGFAMLERLGQEARHLVQLAEHVHAGFPPGTYTASYRTDAATCEVLSTGTGVPSAACDQARARAR